MDLQKPFDPDSVAVVAFATGGKLGHEAMRGVADFDGPVCHGNRVLPTGDDSPGLKPLVVLDPDAGPEP